MNYQKKLDIEYMILLTAKSGASQTMIMASVFMEFGKLRATLSKLASDGLLEVQEYHPLTYKTTQKGLEYLERDNVRLTPNLSLTSSSLSTTSASFVSKTLISQQ